MFNSAEASQSDKETQPPKKRSRLLGDLDLNSEEVQKLLKKKSSHDGELSEVSSFKFLTVEFVLLLNLDSSFDHWSKKSVNA